MKIHPETWDPGAGNIRAPCVPASSSKLWRHLASISDPIYFTHLIWLFCSEHKLSVSLGIYSQRKFRHPWRRRGSVSSFTRSIFIEIHRKERKRRNCLPALKHGTSAAAKVQGQYFQAELTAARMQAEVLHLCSNDRTCPQAAGALRSHKAWGTLNWLGFVLI